MEEKNKKEWVSLYDQFGKKIPPLPPRPVPSITMEEIKQNILQDLSKEDDSSPWKIMMAETFNQAAAAELNKKYPDGIPEDCSDKVYLSVDHPLVDAFLNFYIDSKLNDIKDNAFELDGGALDDARTELALLAGINDVKLFDSEGTYIGGDPLLEVRIGKDPKLRAAKDALDLGQDIYDIFSMESKSVFTTVNISKLVQRLEDMAPTLENEQLAKGYHNFSKLYRSLILENKQEDAHKNNDENTCLKEALKYTSDINIISACAKGLTGSQELVRAACERALKSTDIPTDLYNIHKVYANSYLGGNEINIRKNENVAKFRFAEYHLKKAYKYAPNVAKIGSLKNLANIQRLFDKEESYRTLFLMAMKHMKGKERCQELMNIGGTINNPEKSALLYEKAIAEAQKAKLKKEEKYLIIYAAAEKLEKIYTSPEKKLKLQQTLEKYAPAKMQNGFVSSFFASQKGKSL
mgnify:CR=1 FL=1